MTSHVDNDLSVRVQRSLDAKSLSKNVEAEVNHGTVTLRGRVRSFYHKQLCLSCSQRVNGVREIVDLIEVD